MFQLLFFYFSFRQSLRTDLMVHQSNLSRKSHNMMSAEQRRLLALQLKKQSQDLSEHFLSKGIHSWSRNGKIVE